MQNPIYAIGDIHGQKARLDHALSLIEADGGPDTHIVFLGDYTDRGPDSRAVLDTLVDGRDAGRNWTFLKGNHDRMFEWFMADPIRHDPHMMVELYWLHERLGGNTTLASYGVDASGQRREQDVQADARAAVPTSHLRFLRDLRLMHVTGDLMFVHAGIRPGIPIKDQREEDLLWIRNEFHDHTGPHPKLIVHGHTPVRAATHYGNRVNLDTAAGYDHLLTAAVFDGGKAWTLTNQGRHPLEP
ncbi:metallophosphoesterase family protein [Tateyamaria omphalii]|uniref:Serine/threonine protein phosphatase n=1 Tax=Tateyamaria omphalii TaxID=299262 RepID=A0A1P8MYA1_9RHOB|nr:metallophosphoesterase family protein [Tateyamaria omphalii]APX13060.1 serine/threonine protein phosphatase [Tateyamaria omphalii]